ncbi:tripartite tricarboxylate transporter TctB family protein [Agrococcus sp. KRD186]|uniref:tripartite tricarboxylate transporter TctB family protein n=1 Tax=Agrococcus sp. KRD186 TaxID=2729730 RepID=UPI0019D078AA
MTLSPRIARAAFSAALALLGVAAAIGGWGYGVTQDNGQVGAGFLPLALGVLMILLAGADVVMTLMRREPSSSLDELGTLAEEVEAVIDTVEESPDIDALGRTQRQRNRMLVAVVALLLVALLLIPVLGLLISLGLLMVVIATVVERRNLIPSIIVSAVTIGVFHLVFAVLLRLPMPTGMIGLI